MLVLQVVRQVVQTICMMILVSLGRAIARARRDNLMLIGMIRTFVVLLGVGCLNDARSANCVDGGRTQRRHEIRIGQGPSSSRYHDRPVAYGLTVHNRTRCANHAQEAKDWRTAPRPLTKGKSTPWHACTPVHTPRAGHPPRLRHGRPVCSRLVHAM